MKTTSTGLQSQTDGSAAELGIVEFEGREYAALGACVSEYAIAGYLHGEDRSIGARGEFRTWAGDTIGHYRILSTWRTPHSWLSDRQVSARVTLRDGRAYIVRGGGSGLLARGKRAADQLRPMRRGSRRYERINLGRSEQWSNIWKSGTA